MSDPSANESEAVAERYRQLARNPLVPRRNVEEMRAAFSRLSVAVAPAPDGRDWTPQSWSTVESALRGIEDGLAQRDAADLAEPRRRDLPERVQTALAAVSDCIEGMWNLERTKTDIERSARDEGFVVHADGRVGLGPKHTSSGQVSDDAKAECSRHEHRMMSVLADIAELQRHTVTTIRERLGAHEPGIPWAILECARAGIELQTFEAAAELPASPLRDLMEQLAADMRRAKAEVWPPASKAT